jgi:hypothetical protein
MRTIRQWQKLAEHLNAQRGVDDLPFEVYCRKGMPAHIRWDGKSRRAIDRMIGKMPSNVVVLERIWPRRVSTYKYSANFDGGPERGDVSHEEHVCFILRKDDPRCEMMEDGGAAT